ncbi:ABC transporter permease [Bifidobacterium callitrichos]|uniref:Putative permease domain protein n=1 Tax=Bifidobacterium callitrichos DSM 23973 TaxID=1437609 RepID=A0A087AD87_9BIFI|nr:ABC transporter permease [Bifidobacterium callitrichos]KFI56737.1 putative permease domain protein [Bifidobacterium callitrichos DSM 23973]
MAHAQQHAKRRSGSRARVKRTALYKDAWRAVASNGKRFAAIAVIVAVGVMMMGALSSISNDLRGGLDGFFDKTDMHDLSIVSTFGFDDDDIKALSDVDGVGSVAGQRSASAYTKINGKQSSATVTELNDQGLDQPYLTDGRLPKAAHEIAVTEQYLADSGKALGDTLTFTLGESTSVAQLISGASSADSSDASSESDSGTFATGDYTIVGTVIDPNDIVNPSGPMALISGAKTVYPLFVSSEAAAATDAPYTSALISVDGAANLNTYDGDYLTLVKRTQDGIEKIQSSREQARTAAIKDAVREPVESKLDEQKRTIEALPDGNPMKTAAEQKITEAQSQLESKLDALPDATWIIRDRSALTSYEDVKTESEMISRLGKLFPILFLVIAILVSLTAVARMVEEDRQLIGTYKALGYTRGETMLKYLIYSSAAVLAGGVVGDLIGLAGLPFVFTKRMLHILYVIPTYPLIIDWRIGIGGILLFLVLICGSAMAVCAGSLRLQPAELLRPKAPKAGKTIVLQRIGFVWNHLSFLGKVTARNLFRYKSRALMVIIGVLGCTALMTAGFGMASSAMTMMPRQFGEIATYDVMAVTKAADHDKAQKALDGDDAVESSVPIHLESATLSAGDAVGGNGDADNSGSGNGGAAEDSKLTVQLMVIPDGESLDGYLDLHTTDGRTIVLDEGSEATAVVTANAAKTFGLDTGATVELADAMMDTAQVKVTGVAQYYTGNIVVMSEAAYRAAFDVNNDTDLALNADLIKVKGDDDAQIAFADDLAGQDEYLTVVSTAKQTRDFTKSFLIFFVMIGFIVVMAAILAVVVLYTLASTNISERERELATIKVLGFRKREVHGYVNKEMLLLACLGIAIGLPCGRGLLGFLLSQLDLPGMNIVPNVAWYCYAAAALLALLFTVLVELATNRSLDSIDMVGALKSPE